jgi:phospholipid/cholesterol/gamma-HCH transport system substrate-binding protein
MDERVLRLRLGVVVLAAAAITGFMVILFSDTPLPTTSRYTIYVVFPSAPGVTVGTPVRKSGVTIGRVTNVVLRDDNKVQVTCQIDGKYTIFDNEICRIASASVLGDAILEFVQATPRTRTALKPLEPGSEIQNGVVGGNPMDVIVNLEGDMRSALHSMRAAGDEVQRTAASLNKVIANNEDQLPRIMAKTERAIDQFTVTMTSINDLFGDEETRSQLEQSIRGLPDTLAAARETLDNANRAFAGFDNVARRAEKNLENLEQFTQPLAERGPTMVANIDGSLRSVNELMGQLVTFTDNLNNRQGSIGKLMNDSELYDRLNRTLANAEDITFKLKPIMDDIRVFSDKIARDPRQLGLKGALDRRPTGVGTKQPVFDGGLYGGSAVDCEPIFTGATSVVSESRVFGDEQYLAPSPVLKP